MAHSPFTDVPAAIEEIRAGRMVVVVDDEDRENEGDLTLAAEKVTPEAINFMAKYGRGLVCLAMTEERLDHLRIGPMTAENTSNYGTAFCEAIDARDGVTTGISAYDRARTIKVAIDPATRPSDLARPGHVFPLRARKGGVLVRAGQTEAAVDLARMAGMVPAGIICEIMRDDGTMARVPDLIEFCADPRPEDADGGGTYPLPHAARAPRASRRRGVDRHQSRRVSPDRLRKRSGRRRVSYRLVRGDIESGDEPVLVRMHSHCLMGDVFGSTGCDCHATIEGSMQRIAREGRGALIYLHQTSKGFSVEKLAERTALTFHRDKRMPALPESERKTQREVGIGAQILVGPESAAHSPADQSSAQSCRPGRIRHRDCGTDSGAAGTSAKQTEHLDRQRRGVARRTASWRTGVSPVKQRLGTTGGTPVLHIQRLRRFAGPEQDEKPSRTPSTYIALLRGINLGGHKIVKMDQLRKTFEELGFAGRKDIHSEWKRGFQSARRKSREAGETY